MKKITILFVMALLCLFFRSEAQTRKQGNPLKVGDTFPDLTIQNVLNYKTNSIRLADFKDKLLILDFWNTFCIPCVKHMPVLDSLQKQFAGKIFILPVNSNKRFDPPTKVKVFLKKRKKAFNLPSVVADTVLLNQFQPPFASTCVWIKNGIVIQITDGDEVTASNILKILEDKKITATQLIRPDDDWTKPLFDNGNSSRLPKKYFVRSFLFPFSANLEGNSRQTDSLGRVSRIFFSNCSAFSLLLIAHPDYNHLANRVKLSTNHPELIPIEFKSDSAAEANEYCYEALFSPTSPKRSIEFLRQDLERYFPFTVDSTKVTDSCWVLKLSKVKKLKIGDPKARETNIEDNLGLPIYFYGHAISSLAEILENQNKIPFLDETGYDLNVWLDLPPDLKNMSKVAQSLEKQGIIVTKEIRPIEYLVIKDIPGTN